MSRVVDRPVSLISIVALDLKETLDSLCERLWGRSTLRMEGLVLRGLRGGRRLRLRLCR